MQTPTKLVGFSLGLVIVFGGAAALGGAVGPVGTPDADDTHGEAHSGSRDDSAGHSDGHEADEEAADSHPAGHGSGHDSEADAAAPRATTGELPGGLMVSQQGYTLDLAQPEVPASDEMPLEFRILGPDGTSVTDYTESHGKDLHLIVVRRDMTGFQHVHPRLGDDGGWSVQLDVSAPGEYRVFADFTPAGYDAALILGADLSVAGTYDARPLPAASTTANVDGYTVTLHGGLTPGEESKLTLSVSRDGRPVTDLQPYLEAYGHLVALRDGDLAYLHVHPAGSPGDGSTRPGPEVVFYATVPSAGDYRLFLDFRHGGVVRTAEFTATAEEDR